MVRMRCLSFVLVAALVLAQALGAMHRVVHWHAAEQAQAASPDRGPGWVQVLFENHEDTTCLLLDAIGHDGIPTAAILPIFDPPALLLATLRVEATARFAVQALARGPPASFVS